jgi:hypothetical protein
VGVRRLPDMAGAEGNEPRICRSFSIMSPTGGSGNRHQRLLAALLDPTTAAARDLAGFVRRDDLVPRIIRWWEL